MADFPNSPLLSAALQNRQYLPPELQATLDSFISPPASPSPDSGQADRNSVGLPTDDVAIPPPVSQDALASQRLGKDLDTSDQDALAAAKLQAAQAGIPGAQDATSPAELAARQSLASVRRPAPAPGVAPFQSLALSAPGVDGTPPPDTAMAAAPSGSSGPLGMAAKMALSASPMSAGQNAAQAVQAAPNAVDALPKAPAPAPQDELAAAQQQANRTADMNGALGLVSDAEADFAHAPRTDFYKQQVARANAPVEQLLQRRAAAAQQAQAAQQASERDPTSPRSRAFQKVMSQMLPPGTPPEVVAQMSIADFNEGGIGKALVGARERADALAQAKEKADAEAKREAAKDAETSRHNRAEESLKAREIDVKGEKAGQLKPLPAEINQKISGSSTGAEGLNALWDKFNTVGKLEGAAADLPLVPTSRNAREYGDLLKTSAKQIAPAESPSARENPAAQEALVEQLPHASDSKQRAAQNVLNHFGAIESRLQSELEANRGQYDTSGIERELAKVRAEKGRFLGKAKDYLPAGAAAPAAAPAPSAAPGRITRTDPTTGETRAWNGTAWVKV